MSNVNEDIGNDLIQAAKKGDINEVRRLISEGANVNAIDNSGNTPLHFAAENDHKEVVEVLLKADVIDINAQDNDGCTPLHLAAVSGHKQVVQALLDKGANVNEEDDEENTPLASTTNEEIKTILQSTDELPKAAKKGDINEVRRLISEGANVNAKDWLQKTPLHFAAEKGHQEVVEALLQVQGINVNAKDDSGCTPLHLAAEYGKKDVVKALLDKGANVDVQNDEGETPSNLATDKGIQNLLQSVKDANDKLLKAAESGNIDDVKNLLGKEGKAQVNATDEKGETPLHWAAENGHKEVVKALLGEDGIDVNATDNIGRTPLHLAAVRGHKEVVEALLGEGADINAQNDKEETPLHFAANHDHKDVVKALLDKDGINVNAQDNSGCTPLHLAAEKGYTDIVNTLLGKGADVNAKNDKGETPFNSATDKGIQNLLQSVKDANDKLLKAAKSGNIDDVKNLLGKEGKAQVNARDNSGWTPLHLAAQNNNKEIVDALIKAEGINVNAVDKDEKTPFDLTTNEEIKTLLKAAENPDAGLIDEPSTDSKGVQKEDAGTEKKEKQEGDAQSGSDIAEKGTDITTGSAQPIAPIEPAQTEEQPSSFFGSLFSILMKPFSLIASFFGGFFSWLFGSDEPIQSSSESDQPVVLYQFSLLVNQIRSIAELFNCGMGKRGNKFAQSALKQSNCIVYFIAQNVLFYI